MPPPQMFDSNREDGIISGYTCGCIIGLPGEAGWDNLATLQAQHGPELHTLQCRRRFRLIGSGGGRGCGGGGGGGSGSGGICTKTDPQFCFLECTPCLSWHRLNDLYYERRSAPVDTDAGGLCLASSPGGVSVLLFRLHFRDDPQRRGDGGEDRQFHL